MMPIFREHDLRRYFGITCAMVRESNPEVEKLLAGIREEYTEALGLETPEDRGWFDGFTRGACAALFHVAADGMGPYEAYEAMLQSALTYRGRTIVDIAPEAKQ